MEINQTGKMQIIDHVMGLSVSPADANNELMTLRQLAAGLSALANTIAQLEAPLQDGPNRQCFLDFTPLGLDQGTADLLPSLFHWYGTTICNYTRLVGFLSGIATGAYTRAVTENPDNYRAIKDRCAAYVAEIPELADILVWRNKVFAHFALTDPRGGREPDNAALLDVSTMSPVAYFDRRFRVGGLGVVARGAEATMPSWSLTETYEQLSRRYALPPINA
jgi:hypothetical protein